MWISPQSFLRLSCGSLQPFQHPISRRILLIPPAPAIFNEYVIDIRSIHQEYVSKDAPVPIMSVGLDRHFLAECEARGGVLRSRAKGLAFLGAVDAAEADALREGGYRPFGVPSRGRARQRKA